MRLTRTLVASSWLALVCGLQMASGVLVQPHNYMLDDSGLMGDHQPEVGSLSPFLHDQGGSSEQAADRDIVGIIGDGLARLRLAKMMEQQQSVGAEMEPASGQQQQPGTGNGGQEMSELEEGSLSSSVAGLLLNVAQAAAQASQQASDNNNNQANSDNDASGAQQAIPNDSIEASNNNQQQPAMSARGNIMELDTSGSSSLAQPVSKADLKHTSQWFNPKETIPVLKISSMATPSKYKKVYFRSEKKLVDGAFHSQPTSEQKERKSPISRAFNSAKGVQRRSSRASTSSSAAPPGILQDGVIDFLKKFRDVYYQTRPSQSSSVLSAASSPLAAFMAPPNGSARPNLASALSVASSLIGPQPASAGSGATAAASAAGGAGRPALTAQSYVSFWSKTFPTWVRKMLKQMRRRSLYNSSKRVQAQHAQHASSAIGQAAQAAASSVIESATGNSSSGSAASSTS